MLPATEGHVAQLEKCELAVLTEGLDPVTVVQPGMALPLGRRSAKAQTRGGTLKVRRDPLRTTLFLLIVVSVSRIHQQFPSLAVFRPALTLALLALGYAFLKPQLLSGDKWFRTWPARLVIAMGVMACLSVVFGISPGRAGKFVIDDYSKTLILCFLLMATIKGAQELYLYIWGYVIATGLLVWMSLFVFGMSKAGSNDIMRLSGGYKYDANDIAVVVLVGLGLSLLTFQTSKLRGKIVSLVILVGIGVTIAKTGSRGGFVGLMAEGLALLVCLHSVSIVKRVIFMGVTAGALALAAPPGYWQQMATIFSPKKDYNWDSYSGRRQLAKRGMGYMMMYPLFGIGVNNFPMAEGTISERAKTLRATDAGIKWSVAHNSYLEAGAEMGIPGGLLWIILVPGGVIAMYRLSRKLPKSWAGGDPDEQFLYKAAMYVPVALTGFAASSFFVSFTYTDPIYILAAYMVGLHISVDRKLQRPSPGPVVVPGRRTRGGGFQVPRGAPPPLPPAGPTGPFPGSG